MKKALKAGVGKAASKHHRVLKPNGHWAERKKSEASLTRVANEQAALYHFTDKIYRVGSLTEVYKAALDSILSALNCDRASILLFDDSGVMRFVAWRGLTDAYRQAVEGPSPWKLTEKDPHPI